MGSNDGFLTDADMGYNPQSASSIQSNGFLTDADFGYGGAQNKTDSFLSGAQKFASGTLDGIAGIGDIANFVNKYNPLAGGAETLARKLTDAPDTDASAGDNARILLDQAGKDVAGMMGKTPVTNTTKIDPTSWEHILGQFSAPVGAEAAGAETGGKAGMALLRGALGGSGAVAGQDVTGSPWGQLLGLLTGSAPSLLQGAGKLSLAKLANVPTEDEALLQAAGVPNTGNKAALPILKALKDDGTIVNPADSATPFQDTETNLENKMADIEAPTISPVSDLTADPKEAIQQAFRLTNRSVGKGQITPILQSLQDDGVIPNPETTDTPFQDARDNLQDAQDSHIKNISDNLNDATTGKTADVMPSMDQFGGDDKIEPLTAESIVNKEKENINLLALQKSAPEDQKFSQTIQEYRDAKDAYEANPNDIQAKLDWQVQQSRINNADWSDLDKWKLIQRYNGKIDWSSPQSTAASNVFVKLRNGLRSDIVENNGGVGGDVDSLFKKYSNGIEAQAPIETLAGLEEKNENPDIVDKLQSLLQNSFGEKPNPLAPSTQSPEAAAMLKALSDKEDLQSVMPSLVDRAGAERSGTFSKPDVEVPSLSLTKQLQNFLSGSGTPEKALNQAFGNTIQQKLLQSTLNPNLAGLTTSGSKAAQLLQSLGGQKDATGSVPIPSIPFSAAPVDSAIKSNSVKPVSLSISKDSPMNDIFDIDGKVNPDMKEAIFNALEGIEDPAGDPNAKAKGSSARGFLQWTNDTASRFGVTRGDRESEMEGMVKKLEADHAQVFKNHGISDPRLTIGSWNQGAGKVLDAKGNITNPVYVKAFIDNLNKETT